MYTCDVCSRHVRAVAADPIHVISAGKLCTACLREHSRGTGELPAPEPTPLDEESEPEPEPERVRRKSPGRAEAMRSRWANMSPEARAAHVARMRAGLSKT
jgi:hypothetical protein